MRELHVTGKFKNIPSGALGIDTTSRSGHFSDLSPFLLYAGKLYGNFSAVNVENAWQFSKVYPEFADEKGNPTPEYWSWAKNGWASKRAYRYPVGKGRVPLYCLWDGEHLSYVEARKKVYAPLYARSVLETDAFAELYQVCRRKRISPVYLRDFDGYDHLEEGISIKDVVNNPKRKMGHAFVLWILLQPNYKKLFRQLFGITLEVE